MIRVNWPLAGADVRGGLLESRRHGATDREINQLIMWLRKERLLAQYIAKPSAFWQLLSLHCRGEWIELTNDADNTR